MATILAGDVCRVVAEWDAPAGTIAQLVWHYVVKSGSGVASLTLLNSIHTNLQVAWAEVEDIVSDLYTGATLSWSKWDFTLHQFDGMDAIPLTSADGASIQDPVPHGAAALVKLFTEAARRQARKYVHGFADTAVVEGSLTGAAQTSLASFAAVLDTDIIAGGITMGFCTFNVDDTSPLFETSSLTINTVLAEAVIAYQRRRRPGTGI